MCARTSERVWARCRPGRSGKVAQYRSVRQGTLSGSRVIISMLKSDLGSGFANDLDNASEVEDAGTERDLGEQEAIAILFETHVLEMGRQRSRRQRLDDLHRVLEKGDAVARIEADPDFVAADLLEQGDQLVGTPVLVVLDGKKDLVRG